MCPCHFLVIGVHLKNKSTVTFLVKNSTYDIIYTGSHNGMVFTSDWLANKVILININCLNAILRNLKKNLPCFTKYNINRDASCIASLYNRRKSFQHEVIRKTVSN